METKNFDLAVAEQRGQSVNFILGGVEFSCPLPIPAWQLLELVSKSEKEGAEAITAFFDFLVTIVDASQLEQFKTVMRENRIGFDLLSEIVNWVVEQSTARPTMNPGDLQPTPSEDSTSTNPESTES